MLNSPINFNDPSGHICSDPEDPTPACDGASRIGERSLASGIGKTKSDNKGIKIPKVTGNIVEFNITAGIPLENPDHATIGLLYLSGGVVTDEEGGFQFYYTTLDQKYTPGSSKHMGRFSRENGEKDSAYGIGISLSRGWIFGKDFRTGKFLGKGDSSSFGGFPISGGIFNPREKELNWTGVEVGGGGGFTMGSVSIDTKGLGGRIQLPPILQIVCRINGYCGGVNKE